MPDLAISAVTNELEDAGWLGLTAAGILGVFLLDGEPGALSSAEDGVVWTKSINTGAEGKEFPFGIGKLKINGGVMSAALGINWEDGKPGRIDLLVSFLSHNAITLEVDKKYALQADRKERELPGGRKELIGYQNANQPLVIPFPSAALEFTFELKAEGGIRSAVQLYESLNIAGAASGVVRLSLSDKVVVIPHLGDVGLVMNDLLLDLSSTGVSDFVTRFPEVYTPEWKGLAAQEVSILLPIDDAGKDAQGGPTHTDFIIASAEGFLIDFSNGHFSGKVSGEFDVSGLETKLQTIELEVDIRNNEWVRGDIAVTMDLKKAVDETKSKVAQAPVNGVPGQQTDRCNRVASESDEACAAMPQHPLNGLVRFKGGLINQRTGDRSISGIDVTMESLALTGQQPLTSITGMPARAAFWSATSLFALSQLVSSMSDGSPRKFATGAGLLMLALIDLYEFANPSSTPLLPQLQRIDFPKVGFRYLRITRTQDGNTVEKNNLFELYGDLGFTFKINSQIGNILSRLVTAGLAGGSTPVNLFGTELNHANLCGPIGFRFSNLFLRLLTNEDGVDFMPDLSGDKELLAVLGERPLHVTLTELPAITIGDGASGTATASPKPIIGAQLVKKEEPPVTKYGLSLMLKGLGNDALAIPGVGAGLILYFTPDLSLEFATQLAMEPKFRFIIPPVCYLEGVIDLQKPIPDFGGTQNRVSVDVGIIHSEIKAGDKLQGDKLKALQDFKKYKYQFGGEYAWGDATGPASHPYPFKFSFAEIHYEGKSPLFTVGPVGVFGLGGLLGRNIAPGVAGGDTSAQGIANWVMSDGQAFGKVMNWPEIPASDGSTWHPSRYWAEDKDQWAVGLFVKAGSAWDSGKTATVNSILLVGLPEFWFSLAGIAEIKPIQAKLSLVIAYEHASKSFLMRAAFEYKVPKENGKKIKAKVPFAASAKGDKGSVSLGHYLDTQGGPGGASLFDLFTVKFYYVLDSKELKDFGLVPTSNLVKPNIPGPAIGVGALWQIGPKKYGPSWLNLSLFGAFGFNLALSSNPFLVFGELYAVGYIQLKVFAFKAKLELAARLYGMTGSQAHRFAGEIMVRLGMPWPFDDIEESFDFFLGSGGPPIPEPALESSAVALNRLESVSRELSSAPLVPIDSIIAIRFNKPIYEVNHQAETGVKKTLLTTNDFLNGNNTQPLPPAANLLVEKTVSKFVNEDYEIAYKYVLDRVTVEREELPGVVKVVGQMAASWEAPAAYSDSGEPAGNVEPHHVLYLNTFMPPEMQFSAEALGQFQKWVTEFGYVSACEVPRKVCILHPAAPKPEIDESGLLYEALFRTAQGEVRVREVSFNDDAEDFIPVNLGRLGWNADHLMLPEITRAEVPDSSSMILGLRLQVNRHARTIDGYVVYVAVHLRGREEPQQLRIVLKGNAGTPCGFAPDLSTMIFDPGLLGVTVAAEKCKTTGDITMQVELEARMGDAPIEGVSIRGPVVQVQDNFPNQDQSAGAFEEYLGLTMNFSLSQLCFTRTANERAQWGKTCIAGCDDNGVPSPPGQGVDAIWQNQILEPNTSYAVKYRVRSYGSSQILRANAADDPPDKKNFSKDSNDASGGEFRTVRFRTEAHPSQNINKYVGFTFPSERSSPMYPQGLVPLLSLKNRGLIRKIYEKHYGGDVLRPRLVDLDGNGIEPVKTQGLNAGSSPFDEWLEQMAQTCLPSAQTFTHVQMEVWEKNLKPATNYSLQLTDTSQGGARSAWSVSFETSHYATFQDHVGDAQKRLNNAMQAPLLNPATSQIMLAEIIGGTMNGTRPGFDGAVEAIYRILLGTGNGRLGSAGLMVGRDGDSLKIWGVALELDEPLFGKDGVQLLNVKPGTEAFAERGVYLVENAGQNRLIVRDRSGSRLLIFNSADGNTFAPLTEDGLLVNLSFSQEGAVVSAVADYVNRTLFFKSPAERQAEVVRITNQLRTTSETSALFDVVNGTLTVPAL